MARLGFRFDSLPRDAFAIITDFLLGSDLLPFSHVNHALFTDLLAPNSAVFQSRVSAGDSASLVGAKQRYFTSRSFRFPGTAVGGRGEAARGGTVGLPEGTNHRLADASFTIGLWFTLQPSPGDTTRVYPGGILLGAQSGVWGAMMWEDTYEQFIHVDPQGDLYCSVTDSKEVVARLDSQRWYHLVLLYERSGSPDGHGFQRVYLDAELIHSSAGALHRYWPRLDHMQLGSAWSSRGSKGKPAEDFNCWYGFAGIMDECRIWPRALSMEEIQELKNGDAVIKTGGASGAMWSLQQAEASSFKNVRRVRCSRPKEGHCHDSTEGREIVITP